MYVNEFELRMHYICISMLNVKLLDDRRAPKTLLSTFAEDTRGV